MRNDKWLNNEIQFPRLIAELEATGAFTNEVISNLAESMDLRIDDVCNLIDRAQTEWEKIKNLTFS